ncbi:MAG: DUF3578 domain-containing protein [Candidatus Micrarchaeia archaeon]
MPSELREILLEIATNFQTERAKGSQTFENNPLLKNIREIPRRLKNFPMSEFIKIQASGGQGNWAYVPWIAFLDNRETSTPQKGVYVVYLFSMDNQHIYLTLAQGVTVPLSLMNRKKALEFLKLNAITLQKKLLSNFSTEPIQLGNSEMGENYASSVVFQKTYGVSTLPNNLELESDLTNMLKVYEQYVIGENFDTAQTDFSQAPGSVYENKMALRMHYARERNQSIVKKAKEARLAKDGKLDCEICGFNFNEKYGKLGSNYIEAHHKVPLNEIQGITETKIEDLALICSNCHRMIHIKYPAHSIEEIKAVLIKSGDNNARR